MRTHLQLVSHLRLTLLRFRVAQTTFIPGLASRKAGNLMKNYDKVEVAHSY